MHRQVVERVAEAEEDSVVRRTKMYRFFQLILVIRGYGGINTREQKNPLKMREIWMRVPEARIILFYDEKLLSKKIVFI